jgi:GAF domain
MSTTYSLVSELEQLANALSSAARDAGATDGIGATRAAAAEIIPIASVAERIAKSLGLKNDEVAILGLSTRWKHLYFMAPLALKNVGYIPLSSNSALAARTARERRPEIVNNFAVVRHASVFEGVKIGSEIGEAIQKIISAPILADGRVVGVIQTSRKGPSAMNAGPDFTADDLGKVLALCKPLGKLIKHIAPDPEN